MGGDPADENSPMSSAAGGVTLNYGSRVSISSNIDNKYNFDGPHFYNNSLAYQNTINNNILQNFTINNLMQFVRDVVEGTGGGGSGCTSTLDVVTDVTLSGSGLVFTRRNIGTCSDVSATSVTINTNTCT
jgi:hypothetical protein